MIDKYIIACLMKINHFRESIPNIHFVGQFEPIIPPESVPFSKQNFHAI